MACQIGVIYFSKTGCTRRLASAVMEGCWSVREVSVTEIEIEEDDFEGGRFCNEAKLEQADFCDALIFGAPTYMGNMAAQLKAYFDASSERWQVQAWRDKLAGGFTVGTQLNGDQSSTLQSFATFASQHGMIWVNLSFGEKPPEGMNAQGSWLGVTAVDRDNQLTEGDLRTAFYLGARVTRLTQRLG